MDKWIALKECKDGYIYTIDARNAILGIFSEKENGFIISRHKFSSNYLFTEYHWDTGPPYGTAKPYKKLQKMPTGIEAEKSILEYLNRLAEKVKD